MVVLSLLVNIVAIGYFPNVSYREPAVEVMTVTCRIDHRVKNVVQLKTTTVGGSHGRLM